MKHGKKPTVAQRKFLEKKRLNPANWLISRDNIHEMVLIHRNFGTVRVIKKEVTQ